MADVPSFAPVTTATAPAPEPTSALIASVSPSATASYAAIAGQVEGDELTYADVQALAIYAGGGLPPTRNRGGRRMSATRRREADGQSPGLWRL